MKLSQLKRLIRPLVKECINEVLAEQYLRNLSEARATAPKQAARQSVIGDDEPAPRQAAPRNVQEVLDEYAALERQEMPAPVAAPAPVLQDKTALRQRLLEQTKGDDDMTSLYADALENLKSPNGVSDDVMQKMGVYDKDYSRYLAK